MAEDSAYDVFVRLHAGGELEEALKRAGKGADKAKTRLDKLKATASGMKGAGAWFGGMGMGPLADMTTKLTALTAAAGTAVGALAMGKVVKGGIAANAQIEQMRNTIGTTLQLFNHNIEAFGKGTTAAQQFTANLDEGQKRMKELVTIANESPGGVQQIGELFQALLPGARSITGDMDRIMGLTKQTTLLAAVLGNRFDLVGEQMSRALTGGAGAEMDTWRLLQKPVLEAGQALGYFNKQQKMGAKLTEAFNALSGQQRLKVMEQAMQALGPEVAQHFGKSWDGVMGTAESQLSTLAAKFTKPLYDGYLKFVAKTIADDGPLGGNKFLKLQEAATFFGTKLANAAEGFFNWTVRAADYLVNNWERVGNTLMGVAKTMAAAGATMVALGAARGAFGAAGAAVGGITSAVSSVFSVGKALLSMGAAAIVLAPLLVAIAGAFGGIAVIFGGTLAYVIQNFAEIAGQLRKAWDSGFTSIRPLAAAIDELWGKLVNVGKEFMGLGNETSTVNTIINMATRAVTMLTKALEWLMEFAAKSAGALASALRAADYAAFALDPTRWFGLSDDIFGYDQSIFGDMADAGDKLTETMEKAAKAFREGGAGLDSFSEQVLGFAADLKGNYWIGDTDAKAAQEAPMFATKQGIFWGTKFTKPKKQDEKKDKETPKTPKVKVTIVQYIKDNDPDAIVAGLQRTIKQAVTKPIQSAFTQGRRG